MNKDSKRPKDLQAAANDTEGHRLVANLNYSPRKLGRMAEVERELRERRQVKETRTNRPDRD